MKIIKNGVSKGNELNDAQLEKINAQTLRPLTADEVYTFRIAACDDQEDRDYERFPVETLKGLAPMFLGRTVLFDHEWKVKNQTARVYDTYVEESGGVNRLILCCYMLREGNDRIIAAIDAGILREVSVGCNVKMAQCSICGKDILKCSHLPGHEYAGKTCIGELVDPVDAYEISFVAVPAQPGAGVVKDYTPKDGKLLQAKMALKLEQEKWRYI